MSEKKYKTVISIDCMGGDLGEQKSQRYNKAYKIIRYFLLFMVREKLPQLLLKQKSLLNAYRYVEQVVSMSDKPSQALSKVLQCGTH